MIKLKDMLNEDRMDQSKMFDNSTVQKIASEIKKITKWKEGWNADFEYKEFRFSDGTGGFSFSWDHNRMHTGKLGVSLRKNGKHDIYCIGRYDKTSVGKEKIPLNLKGNPVEWRDFNNDHLLAIYKKVKPMIAKNQKATEAAIDKERKAQSAHYSRTPGRGGTGIE